MSQVEWRPVQGYEGAYEVSNDGQVRGLARRDSRGARVRAYLFTPSPCTKGYLRVGLSSGGKTTSRKVHVLMAEAFLGPRPPGAEVRHRDGNCTNNIISNLRYGTPSENRMDSVRHGTHWYASRTHCPHGHEYTPENTVKWSGNGRKCKTCLRSLEARRWQTRKRTIAATRETRDA